ncbi:androgen-dependent TFPI-regulating protein-like isoform X2 [Cryptotermes secundus]|uniref:androgen-dependent TFPI-regulating protein-like isoform X2 n=1 Tax=Cryptotermes secundus TaxID=105785 RepID=UPI000CD7C330|nr:androgen-dependent TFPI-regulating protein-like isoform X2 [Cryptotermes secundus]
MDVLYALKLLEVLSARTDLLWAHYRGLGLQFFTVWSQVAQQGYFFVAFAYDVIEPSNNVFTKRLKKLLRIFKAVFFTSVVVPTAVLVSVNFWALNSLFDPALIDDTHAYEDFVPSWMNHSLHSYVLVFALAELLLSCRTYPGWTALGRLRSTVVVLAYASWVALTVLVGSAWPYPYLRLMSIPQLLAYLVANCGLAAWAYSLGEYINTAVWGRIA